MKNTLITLASVAVIAGSVNAQVTLEGTTYAAGTYLTFDNVTDMSNGVNATNAGVLPNNLLRDSQGQETDRWQLNLDNGEIKQGSLSGGSTTHGTAAWTIGNVGQFNINQRTGVLQVQLANSALGYVAGDYINFSNVSDFVNGINETFITNLASFVIRDAQGQFDDRWQYNTLNGEIKQGGNPTGNFLRGTALWSVGKVDQFSYNQNTGALQVRVASVPEPSSTALLGLGGLALILRRRKR